MIDQECTVAEFWPEHAEHQVIYSEHGRVDYLLNGVEKVDEYVGFEQWSANDYDAQPINGDIQDTEVWCRTCGVVLSLERPIQPSKEGT